MRPCISADRIATPAAIFRVFCFVGGIYMDLNQNVELLRQELLNEVYAGSFSGLGAMLLDEDKIRQASPDELLQIARQYGIK